jgi:hypothetical protein
LELAMNMVAAIALAVPVKLGLGAAHTSVHQSAGVTVADDGYGWGIAPAN